MKARLFFGTILTLSLVTLNAFARGGVDSGGGDLCEGRIKAVRDDIRGWIVKGGPRSLQLPNGISVDQYSKAMLEQIKVANIKCVAPGDKGFPVEVYGTPKICRFDRKQTESEITCDIQKFQSQAESDQYVLIHHEFAGLAGIERPSRDDSHYGISNQISGYLVSQVIKKLAIKPQGSPNAPSVQEFFKVGRLYRIDFAQQDEISGSVRFPKTLMAKNGDSSTGWNVVLMGDNSISPSLPDQISVGLLNRTGPITWEGMTPVEFTISEKTRCRFELSASVTFLTEEGHNPEAPYPPMNHSYAIITTQVPRGFNVMSDGSCQRAGEKTVIGTISLNWTPIVK